MFILLKLAYCSYVVEYYFYGNPPIVFWLGGMGFYGLDEVVHSIFAIKYWVLSRKINEIVSQT